MTRPRMFAALCLIAAAVFAAVHYSAESSAEAGLFFRRDGAARQPLRTVAAAVAARRDARGAAIIFPRLHAAASRSSNAGSCGSPSSACASGECAQAERVAAAGNFGRRVHFFRALSLFADAYGDPGLARRIATLQRNPAQADAFRAAVQDEFGFTPDTVREWLKLFLEFAPQLIEIILKFV